MEAEKLRIEVWLPRGEHLRSIVLLVVGSSDSVVCLDFDIARSLSTFSMLVVRSHSTLDLDIAWTSSCTLASVIATKCHSALRLFPEAWKDH